MLAKEMSNLWALASRLGNVESEDRCIHFQGESGSLHGLGSHKVNYQEPEFRGDWQLKLMTMPWPLTGWLVELLTEMANRVMNM